MAKLNLVFCFSPGEGEVAYLLGWVPSPALLRRGFRVHLKVLLPGYSGAEVFQGSGIFWFRGLGLPFESDWLQGLMLLEAPFVIAGTC